MAVDAPNPLDLEAGVDIPEDRTKDDKVDMTEPSQAALQNREHEEAGGHEVDDHADHLSDNKYIVIAAILAVITAAEVVASYIDLGPAFIPLLLFMMAVKFFVVVSYFMHLKFDNPVFKRLFYTGLFLAVFVYVAALLTFRFFEA
ncbi:MAG: cytochrome C oxidase subunit IV family protein [Ilumatobacter sp.]|uniref:cytochrome C oxidase subunit IV family protein n=1 Tax=Ilumatobacter sp. TaxID=1967498 RepID=UPI003C769F7C